MVVSAESTWSWIYFLISILLLEYKFTKFRWEIKAYDFEDLVVFFREFQLGASDVEHRIENVEIKLGLLKMGKLFQCC